MTGNSFLGYMPIYMYIYIYTNTYVYVHIYIYVYSIHIQTHMYMYIYIYIYIHMKINTHTYCSQSAKSIPFLLNKQQLGQLRSFPRCRMWRAILVLSPFCRAVCWWRARRNEGKPKTMVFRSTFLVKIHPLIILDPGSCLNSYLDFV